LPVRQTAGARRAVGASSDARLELAVLEGRHGQRRRRVNGQHDAAGRRRRRHRAPEHALAWAITSFIATHGNDAAGQASAAISGYSTAFGWATGIFHRRSGDHHADPAERLARAGRR
jgi:hypothetical protein